MISSISVNIHMMEIYFYGVDMQKCRNIDALCITVDMQNIIDTYHV